MSDPAPWLPRHRATDPSSATIGPGPGSGADMGTPLWMSSFPHEWQESDLDPDLQVCDPAPWSQMPSPVTPGQLDPRSDTPEPEEPVVEEPPPEEGPIAEEDAAEEEPEAENDKADEAGPEAGSSETGGEEGADGGGPGGEKLDAELGGDGQTMSEQAGGELSAQEQTLDAAQEGGGGGGEPEVPPGIEPPGPARLGGVDPVPIPEPPPMDPKKAKRIEDETGLAPSDHHDRVRMRLRAIARMARRLQVEIVQRTEATAAKLRQDLELRADQVPGVAAGAIAEVAGACEQARKDLAKATEDANTELALAGAASCQQVDEAALTAVDAIADVLATSSQAIRDLHEVVMQPIRDLMWQTSDDFWFEADTYAELIIADGKTIADAMASGGSNALEAAKREKVAEKVPQMAADKAAALRKGAEERGMSVTSPEVESQFSLVFLSIVNPAAVHTEETGAGDEGKQDGERKGATIRLATAEERAQATIKTANDQAKQVIDSIEKESAKSIQKSAAQIERGIREQARTLDAGLRSSAPAYADTYRAHMRRLNASFPRGRFHDLRVAEPVLDRAEQRLGDMALEQREAMLDRADTQHKEADAGIDQQMQGIRDSGRSQADAARDEGAEKVGMISRAVGAYVGGFFDAGRAVTDEAIAHQQEVEEKLGPERENQVIDAMKGVEDNAAAGFDQQILDYMTETEAAYNEWTTGTDAPEGLFGGLFTDLIAEFVADLRRRRDDITDAFGGDGDGTNEEKANAAMSPLTPKQGKALEWIYLNERPGKDLRTHIDDEMDGDDQSAAEAYLSGNPGLGLKFEIEASMTWYDDDESRIENATRRLSDAQLATLEDVEGWDETRKKLGSNLDGTDLDVMKALVDEQDRAKADVYRLLESADKSRKSRKETELIDLVSGMGSRSMTDLYGAAGPPPGELDAHRKKMMVAFAEIKGLKGDDGEPLSETEAAEALAAHLTNPMDYQGKRYAPELEPPPPGQQRGPYRYRVSKEGQQAITAMITKGPDSNEGRAARLNFEVSRTRGFKPNEEQQIRIMEAGTNPALAAAHRKLDLETDPKKRESIEAQIKQLEVEQDKFSTEFAKLQGASPETLADPLKAREYSANKMGDVFSLVDSEIGRDLGRSIILKGEADRVLAIQMAIKGGGTHEELIEKALGGLTRAEIKKLRADYGEKFGNGKSDTSALDRDLGTFEAGRGQWFPELSGEDRQKVELLLAGNESDDLSRAHATMLRFQHQLAGQPPQGAPGCMEEAAYLRGSMAELEALLRDALPPGASPFLADGQPNPLAFDENGNFKSKKPGAAAQFRDLTGKVNSDANAYRQAVDRMESMFTNIIAALGIVLLLVLTPFTGGATAAVAAALFTGLGTMAVKATMRGDRYGWEEAAVDLTVTVLDAATAGLGAGKFAQAGALRGAIVRVASGTISGGIQVALNDKTWRGGFGEGMEKVGIGAGKAGLMALVTEGISQGVTAKLNSVMKVKPGQAATGFMQNLGKKLGENGTRVFVSGVSSSLGGMGSEAVGLGLDVASGEFKGTWYEGLGRIGKAGLREFITGTLQELGQIHYEGRIHTQLGKRTLEWMDKGRPLTDAEQHELFKLSYELDPTLNEASFKAGLNEQVKQIRAARDEMLDVFPADTRATLDKLPFEQLGRLRAFLETPDALTLAQRSKLWKDLAASLPGVDRATMLAALKEGRQEHGRRVEAAAQQQRALRKAVSEGLPAHLRGALEAVSLDALGALPPEGLDQLHALMRSDRPPTEAERNALLELAKAADPKVDQGAFLRTLDNVVWHAAASRAVESRAIQERGRLLLGLMPPEARGPLATLSERGIKKVLAILDSGRALTPHERARLLEQARERNPGLDEAAFSHSLDEAAKAALLGRQARHEAGRLQRMEALQDLPTDHRAALSDLPAEGVALLRKLMARGDTGTPRERNQLLRAAQKLVPGLDPVALLAGIDAAVHSAVEARAAKKEVVSQARGDLLSGIPKELRAQFEGVPIHVVDEATFREFTQSQKGDAVTVMVDGVPHVIVKQGADPLSIRAEGMHLLQSKDPQWAGKLARLDESKMRDWHQLPLEEQLALYKNKIEIEIDAAQRMLDGLREDFGATYDASQRAAIRRQMDVVRQTRDNLKRRKAEVATYGPETVARILKGEKTRPQWLDQPARMFNKQNETPEVRAKRIDDEVKQARENNRVRDQKLQQLFESKGRVNGPDHVVDGVTIKTKQIRYQFDHITLGAGFAGVATEMTRTGRDGERDLVVGEPNPWENADPNLKLGQGGEGGVDLPGAPEGFRYKDAIKDADASYGLAVEHANHVLINRDRADIPVLNGRALKVEPKHLATDWPSWAGDANARVLLKTASGEHVWIYVKSVDVAVGPGPGRLPPPYVAKALPGALAAIANHLPPEVHTKLDTDTAALLARSTNMDVNKLVQEGKLRFGDQGFQASQINPGGSVLVFGGGPSGAWASGLAAGQTEHVVWASRTDVDAVLKVPDAEGGALLREATVKLRMGQPLSDAEAAALRKFTFEQQPGNGAFPTNREPGRAFHADTASKIDFKPITNLVKMEFDPSTNKFKVYFEGQPEHPVVVDQVVLTIGQDATRPGGPKDLLSGYDGKLVPIMSNDGSTVVGLRSPDGVLRVMGVAATAPAIRAMVDPRYQNVLANFDVQAHATPNKDSKSVVGGFFMSGRMIQSANEVGRISGDPTIDTTKVPVHKEIKDASEAQRAFLSDFKTAYASHFPAGKEGALNDLQILQLSNEALAGYSALERAGIREHRLAHPYEAPPLPARISNDELAARAYLENFKKFNPELVSRLKLSDGAIREMSDIHMRDKLATLPADQRADAAKMLRAYKLWRAVAGADGITPLTDSQLIDHFRTGGTLDALGHPISPPLPAGAVRPPVLDPVAMGARRDQLDAIDNLFKANPRSDTNLQAMLTKAGLKKHEWQDLDPHERLDALGVLDAWKDMSWEDTVRALRNIRGNGDEVAFQKWLTDNNIKASYDAGLRPSPFSGDMIKKPSPPGVDPNTAPPGWVPPPPGARAWKGDAITKLTPKALREAVDQLRLSGNQVDDTVRKNFEDLTKITEAARIGKRPLTADEAKKVGDLLQTLEGMRIDKNPLAKEAWEEARKRVFDADPSSDQGKMVKKFQDGQKEVERIKLELEKVEADLKTLAPDDPNLLLAQLDQTRLEGELSTARDKMSDDAAEIYSLVRSRFGELMQTSMLHVFQKHPDWFDTTKPADLNFLYKPIPSFVEVHHVLYKAIFPEHAVDTWNLLLAIRNKVKGGDDQLHELMHRLSAGGHSDLFNTLITQMIELLRRHFRK